MTSPVQTWLNAELDGDAPLVADESRTLTVFFGPGRAGSDVTEAAQLPIPLDREVIEVNVNLMSSDFDVPVAAQQLHVARTGRSTSCAVFEIRALECQGEDGTERPHTLSVLVDVRGNFLQRLDLTFDHDAVPDVENYGRQPGTAAVLDQRRATLQFKRCDTGYQLLAPHVCADPIEIRLTEDELAARVRKVRKVMLEAVKKSRIANRLDISESDRDALLGELAFAGFRLFQAVFSGPEASHDLKQVRDWICATLGEEPVTLQVVSSGFPVPWPLMYAVRRFDAQPLSWDGFIGMRHVVEQIPLTQFAMPMEPTIDSTPGLGVRTVYNSGIDDTMPSRPVADQRAYWKARGVSLVEGTSVDDLIKGGLSTSATEKVLYLYCHAEASRFDPDDSKLILTGSTSISLGQLAVYAPTDDLLPSHPLVFINACESGQLTPNFYDGFVPYFLAKGARGVIGTECKTPGLFASEWAKAFFDELFDGVPLGKLVLTLRQRFLADHNNPLGLLYGVHCDTDTVITPALAAAA